MKYLITIFFAAIYCLNAFNQEVTDTLYVSIDHNLFLVFDDKATSLSGNSFIKTKSGGDNDNTVVVMGLEEDFPECNLLVTVEDKMYMFIVRYTPYPKKFIYNYQTKKVNVSNEKEANKNKEVTKDFSIGLKKEIEEKRVDSLKTHYNAISKEILEKKQNIKSLYFNSYGVEGIITNIYAKDDNIVLKLFIKNTSNIKYNVDFLGFQIQSKVKNILKNNSTEEYSIKKLFPFKDEDLKILYPNQSYEMVYIFEKFTLEKKKELIFQITEFNGDRRLKINVPFQYITKAEKL